MGHSRNANITWEAPTPRPAPSARSGAGAVRHGGAAAERRRSDATARSNGFDPGSAAYRVACRLFPGFAELPAGFRASLEGYAPLLAVEHGPLSLREREAIARAVGGREGDGFGSLDGHAAGAQDATISDLDALAAAKAAERERLIAAFAVKVTRRWLAIGGSDVEQLLDAGVPASGIRAIAETAAVFHFLAEISSAMLRRPRLTSGGRAPIAGVASRDPSWRELGRWLA